MLTVRVAHADDTARADVMDAIVDLTRRQREQLGGWAPRWWRAAEHADQIHPLWLGHLIDVEGPVVRVAVDDGVVVGCSVSMLQGPHWFLDDVCVVEDRWADVGAALVDAAERPALTCVATRDTVRHAGLDHLDLIAVSSYHLLVLDEGARPPTLDGGAVAGGIAPLHTFGSATTPAEGGLDVSTQDGTVRGSASLPAPPVYDPGGTVCVVDHVSGKVGPLLAAAAAAAAARGDVILAVVCGYDDEPLRAGLAAAGFIRTVEVLGLGWPG